MEGFYLLCVVHRVKVLETLGKQLGSIFRLESKNKINKLIFFFFYRTFLRFHDKQASHRGWKHSPATGSSPGQR